MKKKLIIGITLLFIGVILFFLSMINIFNIGEKECKELGFDGKYSNNNNCYNKVYHKDGTHTLESSTGKITVGYLEILKSILFCGSTLFIMIYSIIKIAYQID